MITPRRTRLVRVPDLHAFRRAIASCACPPDLADVRSCVVLIPTASAGAQLRDTLENLLLLERPEAPGVAVLPDLVTRDGWYARMHGAIGDAPALLTGIEREVLLARAAREAIAAGNAPPFRLRPALVAEMLVLLETMLRLGKTLDAFERLFLTELESRAPIDRGAERLLRQTHFLADAYRRYRDLVSASGGIDEQLLRERLLAQGGGEGCRRVVVTVGDRSCGAHGLWPVDFDLLARLPGLEQIDVIATEQTLASGFHERLQAALPGFEETEFGHPAALSGRVPTLVAPAGEENAWWVSRDREEEIALIAKRIKAGVPRLKPGEPTGERGEAAGAEAAPAIQGVGPRGFSPGATGRHSLDRIGIVCKRPLPYVYLAQSHLAAAGVPFEAFDELPLAAEPFAAALDLVFRAVEAGLAAKSLIAVMRSPHIACDADLAAIAVLDRVLADRPPCATPDALERCLGQWDAPEATSRERMAVPAAQVCVALAGELAPLVHPLRASEQCQRVLAFLDAHRGSPVVDAAVAARHARARGAIVGALAQLAAAHQAHDDPVLPFREFVARVRRWMEAQTFSPRTGSRGVHLLDAEAARYADFDEVFLVGLIEREWPESTGRPIFYPISLLAHLNWPSERARIVAARSAFVDLVRLPASRVSVSTFMLEDDGLVEPSPLLDELGRCGLRTVVEPACVQVRVLPEEALACDPVRSDVLPAAVREWLLLRQARSSADAPQFHGATGEMPLGTPAVRRLETYLDCPFKYFAEAVLGLREENEDGAGEDRRMDGQFVHEVLAEFYEQWQAHAGGAITAENLEQARSAFVALVEKRLNGMPDSAAALWRARLLGCAARAGIGDIVLRFEASTDERVIGRLLEHRFDGPCVVADANSTRELMLRGVADRIDLLDGHRFRLIDYKLGRAPDIRRAIQLPVYAAQAGQQLAADGGSPRAADAAYLAFGERQPAVRLATSAEGLDQAIAGGQARLLAAVAGIEQGAFPPKPAETMVCTYCRFASVCRKDYVDGQ